MPFNAKSRVDPASWCAELREGGRHWPVGRKDHAAAKADKPKDNEPFNTVQEFTQCRRTFAQNQQTGDKYMDIAF